MSNINNNGFVKSANIKVFPCSYRGSSDNTIFNPEACTLSEYNIVNLYNKVSANKESYVVS
jgi:hypothetical protein